MIEVTQADREAAAAFYGPHLAHPGEPLVTAHLRAGKIDESPLVQAFAAHRVAETAKLRAALAPFARADRIEASSTISGRQQMSLTYYNGYEVETFALNALENAKEAMR